MECSIIAAGELLYCSRYIVHASNKYPPPPSDHHQTTPEESTRLPAICRFKKNPYP